MVVLRTFMKALSLFHSRQVRDTTTDRFEYVVGYRGANSTPAMIEMTVRLPLLARSSAEDGTKHTVPEATPLTSQSYCKDQSNERRPVCTHYKTSLEVKS